MTLYIMVVITILHYGIQLNSTLWHSAQLLSVIVLYVIMLSGIMLIVNAECRNAECDYAECHNA